MGIYNGGHGIYKEVGIYNGRTVVQPLQVPFNGYIQWRARYIQESGYLQWEGVFTMGGRLYNRPRSCLMGIYNGRVIVQSQNRL